MLAPTITMKITSVEDAKRVRQELVNWSKYERTSTHEVRLIESQKSAKRCNGRTHAFVFSFVSIDEGAMD